MCGTQAFFRKRKLCLLKKMENRPFYSAIETQMESIPVDTIHRYKMIFHELFITPLYR